MRIIPAIDLWQGACVRLRQGDFAQTTEYSRDPVAMARGFVAAGAGLLHVIDLEGAKQGRPAQAELVLAIAAAVPIPIEVGGGLRTLEDFDFYLGHGVDRAILGTLAVKDPALAGRILERHGEKVILGVDTRGGLAATEGWTASSAVGLWPLVKRMAALGLKEMIHTDIARDGMLTGPDLESLTALVRESGLKVIASGGISSLADLEAAASAGASGAILGKSLYDGKIDLHAAIKKLEVTG